MPHKAEKDLVILKEQYVHIEKDFFLNQRMYIQIIKLITGKVNILKFLITIAFGIILTWIR